jgi:hypothetical protein
MREFVVIDGEPGRTVKLELPNDAIDVKRFKRGNAELSGAVTVHRCFPTDPEGLTTLVTDDVDYTTTVLMEPSDEKYALAFRKMLPAGNLDWLLPENEAIVPRVLAFCRGLHAMRHTHGHITPASIVYAKSSLGPRFAVGRYGRVRDASRHGDQVLDSPERHLRLRDAGQRCHKILNLNHESWSAVHVDDAVAEVCARPTAMVLCWWADDLQQLGTSVLSQIAKADKRQYAPHVMDAVVAVSCILIAGEHGLDPLSERCEDKQRMVASVLHPSPRLQPSTRSPRLQPSTRSPSPRPRVSQAQLHPATRRSPSQRARDPTSRQRGVPINLRLFEFPPTDQRRTAQQTHVRPPSGVSVMRPTVRTPAAAKQQQTRNKPTAAPLLFVRGTAVRRQVARPKLPGTAFRGGGGHPYKGVSDMKPLPSPPEEERAQVSWPGMHMPRGGETLVRKAKALLERISGGPRGRPRQGGGGEDQYVRRGQDEEYESKLFSDWLADVPARTQDDTAMDWFASYLALRVAATLACRRALSAEDCDHRVPYDRWKAEYGAALEAIHHALFAAPVPSALDIIRAPKAFNKNLPPRTHAAPGPPNPVPSMLDIIRAQKAFNKNFPPRTHAAPGPPTRGLPPARIAGGR